jgi:pilus assembly protein CpaD
MTMPIRTIALATLPLALALSACGGAGASANRSLNSVHQPVVESTIHAIDLTGGAGGLPLAELRRLAGWVEAMDLGYGDRVAIDGASRSDAVAGQVSALLSRRGLLLEPVAPVTGGPIAPGQVRVVVTRTTASVPGCPDWSDRDTATIGNRTSAGYGCAINSNLAAMVADPRHLIEGAEGTGETVVMTSNKAIATYREATATAANGLSEQVTGED